MKNSQKADFVLLLVTFLASSGWLFSKLAVGGMPPLGYIGFRFLGASLLLLPFSIRYIRKLDRNQFFICCLVGVFQALAMSVWILAVNTSERLGEGAFIMSLSLMMVPFLARILYNKKIDRFILYALPFAILGIALLALKGSWQLEASQALFLTATIFTAMHIVYTSESTHGIPAMAVTFIQMIVTSMIAMLASLFFESWPESIASDVWIWILGAILISTSVRYLLLTWALKNSDSGRAALILVIEPVWTAIMSTQFFGEEMSAQNILGCSLILFALLVSRWRSIFPKRVREITV